MLLTHPFPQPWLLTDFQKSRCRQGSLTQTWLISSPVILSVYPLSFLCLEDLAPFQLHTRNNSTDTHVVFASWVLAKEEQGTEDEAAMFFVGTWMGISEGHGHSIHSINSPKSCNPHFQVIMNTEQNLRQGKLRSIWGPKLGAPGLSPTPTSPCQCRGGFSGAHSHIGLCLELGRECVESDGRGMELSC